MQEIIYGLVGRKLSHSFSARYFNSKFEKGRIPSRYTLFEIPSIENFPEIIRQNPDLRGLNVTIPYKEEVIPYLSMLTPTAQGVGAVNTIRIDRRQGQLLLVGHNTDTDGFKNAIEPLLGSRRKALVLGSGGAAKAVKYALRELQVEITQVSRTCSREGLSYSQLTPEVMRRHDIIVNCTPLGTWPDVEECPDIPYHLLSDQYLCFDLVYNPEVTKFMRLSAERGAIVSNGYQMLLNQADAAYRFWNTATFTSPLYDPSAIDYKIEKFLSRHIEIHISPKVMNSADCRVVSPLDNSGVENFYLSIATLSIAPDKTIHKVSVTPFEKEIPGVTYLDSRLTIHLR
ncbi:MAG: shikimate dehydrogenase [Muribaculaceae bacterium]|nr:shikimate dehydrogenase [Muribaculaceae bacterium]